MPRSDKGGTHNYDSSWRKLQAMLRAEEPKERREGRPLAERRAEAREAALPADRVCPLCRALKLKSRQWVVTKEGPICLSCHRSNS